MTDAENGAPEESSTGPDTGGAVPAQASAERDAAEPAAGADAVATDSEADPGADAGSDSDSGSGSDADGEAARAGAPDAAGPSGGAADRAAVVAALAERVRSVGRSGPGSAAPSASPAAPGAPAPADGTAPASPADRGGTDRVVTDEQRAQALRATAEVLGAGGAPAGLAGAAVSVFGDGAAEQLREDPWAVLSLPGVRPEHADGFARGLLGPAAGPGDPRRAQALVGWLLEQAALRGHSALEIGEVTAGLERLGVPDSAAAVQAAVLDGRAMPFQEELTGAEAHAAGGDDEDEPPTRTLLALERLALAEESLADGLVRLMSTFVPGEDQEESAEEAAADSVPETADEDSDDDADGSDAEDGTEAAPQAPAAPGPAAWEAAAEAAPSSSAAALVRAAAANALVLHTGGEAARAEPAALLATATGLGLRAWAATWTDHGRTAFAALAPLADVPAPAPVATLAELLAGAAGPGRSPDGTLALDLLVVLDAPLLDVELAATLLESLADGTRLVLSGDPGQLWSAGPGRFFADLLTAKVCPAVASRTPDFGPIGELVSGVGIGELQPVDAPDKEVVILTAKDSGEAVHRAVQLLTDSIPRALGIPSEQVVLLTPGHGGGAGTRALNAAAKARLNPGPGRFAGFDPGDRVADSPAPGHTRPARVVDGDAAGLHLEYPDGTRRTVPPAEAQKLRHGWALTVHQAVGRHWPGAVVVVPDDAAPALSRQWVYTAFGRGERHLSVVHAAGPALPQAVAERPAAPRTTRLRAILAENAAQEY
ncbi:Helix-hairpin-helix containing domain-containing protein [Streptomyces sp. TLI_053]|uniref:ATP-binding domain-containing protein n=1 Tax=Streptomyces sp. TLI_053 TaxID=1855352 RepID=UPI00087B2841|nr:ATP-binding domain-containing protein [Streptomyces sp. TLI_053]SDT79516.1 Helix-hairpin-helix containing domain-containing protein [Streptomyces sp. TLI_053]